MDNDLKQFFDEWKEADQRHRVPEFPAKRKSRKIWWYAAAVVILGFAAWQVNHITTQNEIKIAQDSVSNPTIIVSKSTDIYEWESPTESLASDF